MKKCKILMIGLSENLGGIETYLINLYRKINKNMFDITFLVFKNTKPCFYDEIKENLIYISSRNDNYNLFKKELKEILCNNNYDYVHCNLMSFSLYEPILYALKYSNSKIILHSHVSGQIRNKFKTEVISAFAKKIILQKKYSERFIFFGCSQNAIDDLFGKYYLLNRCNYYVVNNGIDINKFLFSDTKRVDIRKKMHIDENEFLIGHVGRFTYAKNHKKILSVFKKIIDQNQNKKFKLILIGDGELKQDILNTIKKYKITDKVILISNVNNVYDYLSAMDYFIFPSIFEGLGIAVIEAQAAGLTCLISSSIPKEIELTKNIIRCDINSSDEKWASYIIKNSSNLNRKINIDLFKEFDSSKSVLKIEKIYLENCEKGEEIYEKSRNGNISLSK